MAACLNAKFGLWTNGDERYCIVKREKDGGFVYDEIPEIPSFGQTEAEIYRSGGSFVPIYRFLQIICCLHFVVATIT